MDNCRKIAVDTIEQVLKRGAYSNIILGLKLNESTLNDKDKALATEIVYGTLKYKYTIDKILKYFIKEKLEKLDSIILNILRMSIYQLKFLDKVPEFAVVDEAVKLAKKLKSVGASKFTNGVLRNYLRNKDILYYNNEDMIETLAYQYSYEPWMVKLFIKQYKIDTAKLILEGLNKTPKLTVRVNSIKTSYDEAFDALKENGYDIEEGYICPEAIRINKGKNIEQNPLFKDGLITVQDESAMLVASSMDITPNLTVFDLCSAPGGKTTHISELLSNTGKVLAYDVHENKLSLIKNNTSRLGITNIICDVADATHLNEELVDKADRVLIDVPCSGIGIIRKKPEIKWTKDIKQLRSIIDIQRNIMNNASKYVKIGGRLLYSTCTLNKEENEENIKWFLKNHPNFIIEPLYYGKVENIIYNDNGMVTIIPNEAMDGFFITKLKKKW